MELYDLAIIGAGPAGLMGAVYAGRYAMKTIVFGEVFGGTISEASEVGNFPAFVKTTGIELSQKMVEQVTTLGIEIIPEAIRDVQKTPTHFVLKSDSQEIHARKILLAIGTKRRYLGIKNEKELAGKGISYCATCDGMFFKNKIVGIVGGGDAALSAAVLLADVATKVYIIYRGATFNKPEPAWLTAVNQNKKIEPLFSTTITELRGSTKLESVILSTGNELALNGLFVEIGSEPDKSFLAKLGVTTNPAGYVVVDKKMRTSVPGIVAAGEVNADTFRQAVVAAAEGAIAANTAYDELKLEKGR